MKINNIIDLLLSIVLIVCAILFCVTLIKEIIIMSKLEYPAGCIKINNDYYCRQRDNEKDFDDGIRM